MLYLIYLFRVQLIPSPEKHLQIWDTKNLQNVFIMTEDIASKVKIVMMNIQTKFAPKQTALMTSVPLDIQIRVNMTVDVNLEQRKSVYSPMLLLKVKMKRKLRKLRNK